MIMIMCITFPFTGLAKASDANMTNHISVKPIEGGHLILQFEAVSNYPPSGVWFAKGNEVKDFSDTNSTREIIGTEGASNVYRFKLLKSNIHRNDSGLYQGYITFGGARYWFKNFTVLVKCKSTYQYFALREKYAKSFTAEQLQTA